MSLQLRNLPGLLVIMLLGMSPLLATKMLHRNAQQLSQLADRIFVGICHSVSLKSSGPLMFTEYEFEVLDAVKGLEAGATLVFRQLAVTPGAGRIPGFPSYEKGKKYLLFLREDSQLGLTSPIGLGQGAFGVFAAEDGSETAVNAFGNRGLFHGMDSLSSTRYTALAPAQANLMKRSKGPVALNLFTALVRQLAKSEAGEK